MPTSAYDPSFVIRTPKLATIATHLNIPVTTFYQHTTAA